MEFGEGSWVLATVLDQRKSTCIWFIQGWANRDFSRAETLANAKAEIQGLRKKFDLVLGADASVWRSNAARENISGNGLGDGVRGARQKIGLVLGVGTGASAWRF